MIISAYFLPAIVIIRGLTLYLSIYAGSLTFLGNYNLKNKKQIQDIEDPKCVDVALQRFDGPIHGKDSNPAQSVSCSKITTQTRSPRVASEGPPQS